MKGFSIPLIGVLILIIITASYALMIFHTGTIQTKIIVNSEMALSLSHKTEFLRKMIDEYVPIIANKVTYDLGKNSGGFSSWDKNGPTENDLINIYGNILESRFTSSTISDSTAEIIFSDPEVTLTDYSNSDYFFVNLDYNVKLVDKYISATSKLDTSGNSYRIDSKYFEAVRKGRKLFEGEDYLLSDSIYDIVKTKSICSSAISGTQVSDFLEYSIICGLDDVSGLAYLSDTEIIQDNSVETKLDDIEDNLKSYLNNKYSDNFDFTFISEFTRSGTNIKIDLEVIIDTLKQIPLTEKEVNEGLPPLDNVVLKFSTDFNYQP